MGLFWEYPIGDFPFPDMVLERLSKLHEKRKQESSGLEKCTPSDIHRRQIFLIGCLHDQLIHLTIHRQWNGLLGHKTPQFVPDILQNTGGGIRDSCMGAAL